jgi:hypothetical protein
MRLGFRVTLPGKPGGIRFGYTDQGRRLLAFQRPARLQSVSLIQT